LGHGAWALPAEIFIPMATQLYLYVISADTTADILPARTIRVLDMQSPGLPHARLLEVGRLELGLIKSVDLSPTMQGHARHGCYY
jgi:hypothetical protein